MVVSLCSFWVNLNGNCYEYLTYPNGYLFFIVWSSETEKPQQVGYFSVFFSRKQFSDSLILGGGN